MVPNVGEELTPKIAWTFSNIIMVYPLEQHHQRFRVIHQSPVATWTQILQIFSLATWDPDGADMDWCWKREATWSKMITSYAELDL